MDFLRNNDLSKSIQRFCENSNIWTFIHTVARPVKSPVYVAVDTVRGATQAPAPPVRPLPCLVAAARLGAGSRRRRREGLQVLNLILLRYYGEIIKKMSKNVTNS